MKFWVLCVTFLLTGCGSLVTDRMFNDNLLDVAPKGDFDVRYPEWGYAPQKNTSVMPNAMTQPRSASYEDLRQYLLSNGIQHEVVPGDYPMIKLNNTVRFETGSAKVSMASKQWLDTVARFLATESGIDIVLKGIRIIPVRETERQVSRATGQCGQSGFSTESSGTKCHLHSWIW